MTDEKLLSETSLNLPKPPVPVQVTCLEQGGAFVCWELWDISLAVMSFSRKQRCTIQAWIAQGWSLFPQVFASSRDALLTLDTPKPGAELGLHLGFHLTLALLPPPWGSQGVPHALGNSCNFY